MFTLGLYNDRLRKIYPNSEDRFAELRNVNLYFTRLIRNDRRDLFEKAELVDDMDGIEPLISSSDETD